MWIVKDKNSQTIRLFNNKPILHDNGRLKKYNPHLDKDIPPTEWFWVDEQDNENYHGIVIPSHFVGGYKSFEKTVELITKTDTHITIEEVRNVKDIYLVEN